MSAHRSCKVFAVTIEVTTLEGRHSTPEEVDCSGILKVLQEEFNVTGEPDGHGRVNVEDVSMEHHFDFPIPSKPSWSNTFNSDVRSTLWGHISKAAEAAHAVGYPYMAFNQRVYRLDTKVLPTGDTFVQAIDTELLSSQL